MCPFTNIKNKVLDTNYAKGTSRVQISFVTPSGKKKRLTREITAVGERGIFRGKVFVNGTVTGQYVWNPSMYDRPVFISAVSLVKGRPFRTVDYPINSAIILAINAIASQADAEAESVAEAA